MLITAALVAGELSDAGQRRWWAARPLTTDTVAGLLVLLVTVLVVNEELDWVGAGHLWACPALISPSKRGNPTRLNPERGYSPSQPLVQRRVAELSDLIGGKLAHPPRSD